MTTPVLHLMCGKIASGKSTLAKTLVEEHAAILISEDRWLAALYPEEIRSVTDYLRCARRLRDVLQPLVIDLLGSVSTWCWIFRPTPSLTANGCGPWLIRHRLRIVCITWTSMTIPAAPDCARATPRASMSLPPPMQSST